jgi:hypothetical protein
MNSNSVVVRTESNKDCSESIVSQEISPTIQKYGRYNKTAILNFPKAKGVMHFSSDYRVIKRQVLAKGSLSGEEHRIVEEHDNAGKKGTLACQHKMISSNSGSTSLNDSTNRSDRSMKGVVVGCHLEEKHDIIHIMIPCISTIFDRVCFASNLPNSQSDPVFSVDASTSDASLPQSDRC